MTIDERLHHVAVLLEATAELGLRNEQAIKKVIESQELQDHAIATLAETTEIQYRKLADAVAEYVKASNERMNALTQGVNLYIADSRERMKQMEANLDALIRIITAEHSNGKGSI